MAEGSWDILLRGSQLSALFYGDDLLVLQPHIAIETNAADLREMRTDATWETADG